jgi:hypothetical protein
VYEIVKHIKIPEVEAEDKTSDFPTKRHQSPGLTVRLLPSAQSDFTGQAGSISRSPTPQSLHSSQTEQGWALALPGPPAWYA